MTPNEPKAGSVPPELEEMMLEDFGPPDHVAAETDAVNIIMNFEPQDCDEADLNNARAYIVLRAELAQAKEKQLAAAKEEIERLKAVLTRLEWSRPDYEEGGINLGPGCPACGGHKYGTGYAHHEPGGHRKNCDLSAALARKAGGGQ